MKTSLPLGRIAGVRVGANLSVLVIVAVLVAGLGFSRFPELLPGRSVWAYLSAAALATARSANAAAPWGARIRLTVVEQAQREGCKFAIERCNGAVG